MSLVWLLVYFAGMLSIALAALWGFLHLGSKYVWNK